MLSLDKYKKHKEDKKLKKIFEKKKAEFEKRQLSLEQKKQQAIENYKQAQSIKYEKQLAKLAKTKQRELDKQARKVLNKKPLKQTKSRWHLVRQLDSIFSKYIRLSYANKDWLVQCVTSGKRYHWKEIQCGHYISRSNYKYRRDEKNCFPQSYHDNVILSWNYKVYRKVMEQKHWELVVDNMENDKELVKISTPRIEEQIEHYTKIVKHLLEKIQ